MRKKHHPVAALIILLLAALACNLPSSDTAEIGTVVFETETESSSGSPTEPEGATNTPVTPSTTFTALAPTETSTPIPSATPTDTPAPDFPIVVVPAFTYTSTPFVVFPVFPVGKGSVSGFVFFDLNVNGVFNPEIGEIPAKSGNARIMSGACPGGEIVFQAATAANGTFSKTDLPVGTYCILIVPNGVAWGGSYVPTLPNPAQRTVQVTAGNNASAGIFGFRKQ